MPRAKELRDLDIKIAISGNDEDIGNTGVQIEEDYFRRERNENRREAGFYVREQSEGRTDLEKDIWKSLKQLEALAAERWMAQEVDEESHLEKNYDEDRFHPYVPKTIVKV